ncbi:hypothetical protein HYR99_05900 [Candidatus Poribacteria bacterium]|nr:hypothetical protein [Candidatus Poribacteria bacterium]
MQAGDSQARDELVIALEPVGKNLVEAKAIFTRAERAKLPEDVQLTIGVKP